jgi:C1A family cysteine protease
MNQLYAKNLEVPETGEMVGTGWLPPLPDMRDYTAFHVDERPERNLKKISAALGIKETLKGPSSADLRAKCSPIENQLTLGSCTAHAGVGVIEYCENRAYNRFIDASRLFIYKTTRNLMGVVGDTGAWLRTTMAAMRLCGAPPEDYWPYTDRKQPGPAGEQTFDEEPTSFVYALAEDYESIAYFTHDPLGQNIPKANVLNSVKTYIAYGFPSMFGFYGFGSSNYGDVKGAFPFPCPGEHAIWGHAVVAVGYDDTLEITNKLCNKKTKGAFLIRNSWGTSWGDNGYGWLPYKYVEEGLALDFWTLISMQWVDTKNFGLD